MTEKTFFCVFCDKTLKENADLCDECAEKGLNKKWLTKLNKELGIE